MAKPSATSSGKLAGTPAAPKRRGSPRASPGSASNASSASGSGAGKSSKGAHKGTGAKTAAAKGGTPARGATAKGGAKGKAAKAAAHQWAAAAVDDSELVTSFIAAKQWDGPQPFRVFRSGGLGQGYYLDVRGGATLTDVAPPEEPASVSPSDEAKAAPTGGGEETAASPASIQSDKEETAPEEASGSGGWLSWFFQGQAQTA